MARITLKKKDSLQEILERSRQSRALYLERSRQSRALYLERLRQSRALNEEIMKRLYSPELSAREARKKAIDEARQKRHEEIMAKWPVLPEWNKKTLGASVNGSTGDSKPPS